MRELEDAHVGRSLRLLEGTLVASVICGVIIMMGGQVLPPGTDPAQVAGQTVVLLRDGMRSVGSEADVQESKKTVLHVKREASSARARIGEGLDSDG